MKREKFMLAAIAVLTVAVFSHVGICGESVSGAEKGSGLKVKMLPGEKWWGLCNSFGREMPFTESSVFSCDLRLDNYSHQSLSLLCSDRGRVVWCDEPVGAEISGGTISLKSDKGEIVLESDAGRTLADAYRYASRKWFKPTGEEPELLYFSAPQYNTWIELTYHQNEKDILAYAKSMLDNGLPPGVFMIDDTWQHGYGEWYFDMRRFSDPKGMMDNLHAMGFKVLLWMCPFVSMDTPAYRRIARGRNPDDVKGYPVRGGFMGASREKDRFGIMPPAAVEWWNGKSALLDFTHPNAVDWFTGQLDRLVKDYGADGFKFDGGGVEFYSAIRGGFFAHDPKVSPSAQSALYGAFALKYKGSEYRNGFGFAGKPVIMRLHDKNHSWKALGRLVPDMLAAGFVGCPFICPDMIGGGEWTAFLPGAPFDPELFIRSAQVHALCPMMQISASPWRVLPAEHQRIFKKAVELRQLFAPRFVEMARESARTGEPMMRNLEYAFPGMGYGDIKDEFMMGDTLLVAPVMEKGARSRRVVLPPGRWRSDDGAVYDGPATIEIPTPLDRVPHFERAGAPEADMRTVSAGDYAGAIPSITDIRPSADGRTAFFASGSDGFGEIDLESGSVAWRRGYGEALRSIAPVAGGHVAVSTSSGKIVLSSREADLDAAAAPGAGGLWWDARRGRLWAVARTNLLQYAVSGGRLTETGRWDYRTAWRDTQAGDLSGDGGDGLYLTTAEALLHFDVSTESFSLVRLERNIRSYSHSRDRGGLMSSGGECARRWRTPDAYRPSPAQDNRPEEIRRAGRTEDAYPPLIDFEGEDAGWTVSADNAVASFARARDRQLFGDWTGRLTYRGATNGTSTVRFRPREPVALPADGFDTFTVWIHGTRFGRGANTDPSTPRPDLKLNLVLADGTEREYWLANPDWKNWFPVYCRFRPDDLEKLRSAGARFNGFTLAGAMQPDERVFHFDNIAFFAERFGPLGLKPRARRNLTPLKGYNIGNNTGAGTLPFPVREETILPPAPVGGPSPEPQFALAEVLGPEPHKLQVSSRRSGKSLIVDFYAPAGAVTAVVAAAAMEGVRTKSFAVPFMAYGPKRDQKLLVDILDGRYFRVAQFDWYRSNASAHIWRDTPAGRQCGVRYLPKTDGGYNDLSERLFITLSDTFDDVMPTVPNPPSPWRGEIGSRGWRNHGASFRSEDRRLWQAVHDRGIRRMTVTDHETCWRDAGESYTYRTHAAPAKGGDEAMREYSRFMRETLGFRYGPYNNYVELAPVNGNWTWDMVSRWNNSRPIGAWVRTYATKASMSPYWSETVAGTLKEKFGFTAAYCDVHTAVAPWSRIDYDARVPGAGTMGEVFYAWGEVMLTQKKAWNGPVFSEGGFQCMYAGLSDGNYAHESSYDFMTEPWIVDFELKRIHPLEIEIGMGSLRHFSPSKDTLQRRYHRPSVRTVEEVEPLLDRYIAAELAFGHAGYLIIDWLWNPPKTYGPSYGEPSTIDLDGNPHAWRIAARSHFMTLAAATRYSTASVLDVRYLDGEGRWLDVSDALRSGAQERNQISVRYDNGVRVVVNASMTERLKATVGGVALDLPPSGYRAWTEDGSVLAESSDRNGRRYDYCHSPEYVYLDGRGHFVEMPRASGAGASVRLSGGSGNDEHIVFWEPGGTSEGGCR